MRSEIDSTDWYIEDRKRRGTAHGRYLWMSFCCELKTNCRLSKSKWYGITITVHVPVYNVFHGIAWRLYYVLLDVCTQYVQCMNWLHCCLLSCASMCVLVCVPLAAQIARVISYQNEFSISIQNRGSESSHETCTYTQAVWAYWKMPDIEIHTALTIYLNIHYYGLRYQPQKYPWLCNDNGKDNNNNTNSNNIPTA